MKLRSLFLASLAALAMVSCSNENDPAIDGGEVNVEKKALLDLGFVFPKAAETRATEAGLATEYEFKKIAIIMDYETTPPTRVVEILDRDAFSPANSAVGSDNVVIYTKQAIKVAAGTATIHAIINPDKTAAELAGVTYANMTLEPTYTALDALTASGMSAANDNFMMTNATAGIEKEFTEFKTTNVEISVTRVVAKLMETSGTATFTNVPTDVEEVTSKATKELKIKLVRAAYVNLAKKSSVFPGDSPIATSWLFEYPASWDNLTSSDGGFDYVTLGSANSINYCFENGDTHSTGIIYEAEATWGEQQAAQTFYIAAGKLYLTYEALKADFRDCPEQDASAKAFHDVLIRKYEGGKCYYYQTINTTGAAGQIKRNNVYKMSVTGVLKIGNPTIITEKDETLMNLSIKIDPWTVNENAFELE